MSCSSTLAENVMEIQEKDRFDVILANPPLDGSERAEIQQNFPVRSGETAYLFPQHFIRSLRAGGRAGIVIKNTFLSNTNGASVALRRELLESCHLHTVLDMPRSCGAINVTPPKYWITSNAMILHLKGSRLNKPFLAYALQQLDLSEAITGVAQPRITRSSLAPVLIRFPPLPEQQRIIAILDQAFDAIAQATTNCESNLSGANVVARAKMDAAPAKIEESNGSTRLGDMCDFENGDRGTNYPQSPFRIAFSTSQPA